MKKDNPYSDNLPMWGKAVFAAIIIIWLALIVTSCTTQKKATGYFNNHSLQAAEYCANAFPVRDSIIYKPGQIVHKLDTQYLPGDSVPCPPTPGQLETKLVYVKCPPIKIITDSVFIHDTTTVIRENMAKVSSMQQQNAVLTNQLEKAKPWKSRAIWTWVIAAVLIGAIVYFNVRMGMIKSVLNNLKK